MHAQISMLELWIKTEWIRYCARISDIICNIKISMDTYVVHFAIVSSFLKQFVVATGIQNR